MEAIYTMKYRCTWVGDSELYQHYHDHEWGKPIRDEKLLFEQLCLESQQAGLSWITVLKKRACYRQHFFQYDIAEIAQFSDDILMEKCQDQGLIRHLAKLKAIRDNAQAWLNLKQQGIDVVHWLWDFMEQQPIIHSIDQSNPPPSQTEISVKLSKQLKKHGFKFVGATTCYAFMQAVGMVDDHHNQCFCKHQKGG